MITCRAVTGSFCVMCRAKFSKADHSTRMITARNTWVTVRNSHMYRAVPCHNRVIPWRIFSIYSTLLVIGWSVIYSAPCYYKLRADSGRAVGCSYDLPSGNETPLKIWNMNGRFLMDIKTVGWFDSNFNKKKIRHH